MRSRRFLVLLGLLFLVPLACGGGGGGGGGGGATMSLRFVSPPTDLQVEPGARVIIRYRDDDLDGPSDMTTSLVAVPEGASSQTVQISGPRPHGNGIVQTVFWDTTGAATGEYRIQSRSLDEDGELIEEAPGHVTVSDLPISVLAPLNNPIISRGGYLRLAFTAFFPNEPVLLTWFLDRDGSLATDSDRETIVTDLLDANGAPQEYFWEAQAAEVGLYRIFVTVERPGAEAVTLQTAAGVQFGSVSCAGNVGTSDTDLGFDVASFPDGSSVIVGAWNGVAPIGHAFASKFSSGCNLLWSRGADNEPTSVFTRVRGWSDGSFLVLGTMGGPGTLGLGETNQTAVPAGPFLARYTSNGPLAWVKTPMVPAGATLVDYDTLSGGDYVVTGTYTGSITFTNPTLNVVLNSAGGTDVFMARYNSTGQFVWARSAGGAANDVVFSVRALANGSTIAFGGFSGTATFGNGEANQTLLNSIGALDSFVARFAANGNLLWAAGGQVPLQGTPPGPDLRFGIFPDGGFVIAGPLMGLQNFALGTPEETSVETAGQTMFVARFGSDRAMDWVKKASDGSGMVRATDLATFPTGGTVIVGDIDAGTLFGPGEREETTLGAGGFRALWRNSGNLGFVRPAVVRANAPLSVAAFGDGAFLVGGDFFDTVTFGEGTPAETTLTTPTPLSWDSDARIAKFNGDGDF